MKNHACPCLLAAAVLLSAAAVRGAQTEGVTIPFPRGGSASVGLANGPMLIRSVVLKGRPSARDLRSARHDRDDKTLMRWVFQLANAGRRDWHARIRVRVYSADERLLASNDREGEVNARDWHDQITVVDADPHARLSPRGPRPRRGGLLSRLTPTAPSRPNRGGALGADETVSSSNTAIQH